MKRKFSGERFYTLFRKIVVVISVLAALWTAFSLYMYEVQLDKVYDSTEASCRRLYYEKDYTMYLHCSKVPFENFKIFERSWLPSALVALLLPAAFFSTSWFYRYTFPIQKTDDSFSGNQRNG